MTQKKTNLSKILINFVKIQKLTLTFKTSLHRSLSYRGSFQTQRKLDLLTAQARLSLGKRHSAQRVLQSLIFFRMKIGIFGVDEF